MSSSNTTPRQASPDDLVMSASTPLLNNSDLEVQYIKDPNEESSNTLKEQVLENYKILFFTAMSFLFFVIAEIIGAFASGSLSLLGDAGAMSVDVFTVSLISFL